MGICRYFNDCEAAESSRLCPESGAKGCLVRKSKPEKAEAEGSAVAPGYATDLAGANKELTRLRRIIKDVWTMYEDQSQVWWDSNLLMELQEVAEQ